MRQREVLPSFTNSPLGPTRYADYLAGELQKTEVNIEEKIEEEEDEQISYFVKWVFTLCFELMKWKRKPSKWLNLGIWPRKNMTKNKKYKIIYLDL